jgi:hypothetical protein
LFSLHLELVRWVFALVFGLDSVDPLGLDSVGICLRFHTRFVMAHQDPF